MKMMRIVADGAFILLVAFMATLMVAVVLVLVIPVVTGVIVAT
jgi:hypothetical protein